MKIYYQNEIQYKKTLESDNPLIRELLEFKDLE